MTAIVTIGGGILVAALGAFVGSFVTVITRRVPRGEPIGRLPGHCAHCGTAIRGRDGIPLMSWMLLGGRCRACSARIPLREPLTELAGLLAFLGVFLWWSVVWPVTPASLVTLLAYLYLAAISIGLALIDIDVHRLPNAIVLPSYLVMSVLLAVSSVLAGDPASLFRAVIGGAAVFAVYLLLALVWAGGMGFGDVKLAGVLGIALAWLGWGELAVGVVAPFLLGGVFGAALLLVRRAGRRTSIPFGPWMLLGAWIGILAGRALATGYLRLNGIG